MKKSIDKTLDKVIDELDNKIVWEGLTTKQLKSTFNLVCNKENWKLPIDAEVDVANLSLVCMSIAYFVGCFPNVEWTKNGRYYRVTSNGYYNIIGT